MKKIGFDFGTTNSTISFYNEETKSLDCFQMNAGSTEYIPTVVAYKGTDYSIGEIAKKNMTKKGYEAYEHFKLRLRLKFTIKRKNLKNSVLKWHRNLLCIFNNFRDYESKEVQAGNSFVFY